MTMSAPGPPSRSAISTTAIPGLAAAARSATNSSACPTSFRPPPARARRVGKGAQGFPAPHTTSAAIASIGPVQEMPVFDCARGGGSGGQGPLGHSRWRASPATATRTISRSARVHGRKAESWLKEAGAVADLDTCRAWPQRRPASGRHLPHGQRPQDVRHERTARCTTSTTCSSPTAACTSPTAASTPRSRSWRSATGWDTTSSRTGKGAVSDERKTGKNPVGRAWACTSHLSRSQPVLAAWPTSTLAIHAKRAPPATKWVAFTPNGPVPAIALSIAEIAMVARSLWTPTLFRPTSTASSNISPGTSPNPFDWPRGMSCGRRKRAAAVTPSPTPTGNPAAIPPLTPGYSSTPTTTSWSSWPMIACAATACSSTGPWPIWSLLWIRPDRGLLRTLPRLTNLPSPALACHHIHTLAGEKQPAKAHFYDCRENLYFPVTALPSVAFTHEGRAVQVAKDPHQRLCLQCHAPSAAQGHRLGSSDDRTPFGVHEGLSCLDCHQPHNNSAKAACSGCHPAVSHCGLDVEKMDTSFFSKTSEHNIHTVACRDCHPRGVPGAAQVEPHKELPGARER